MRPRDRDADGCGTGGAAPADADSGRPDTRRRAAARAPSGPPPSSPAAADQANDLRPHARQAGGVDLHNEAASGHPPAAQAALMGALDATGAYVHSAQAQHDPQAMLRLCVARFLSGGYTLTGQGPGWVSAMRGFTGYGPLAQAHSITVRCDGWNVAFEIRGQLGFGFLFVPQIDHIVGETLAAYDSWMIQHAVMGPPPSQHGYPPPPSYDQAPHSRGPTHVVERQVVVVRCKFCQAHTPLDGAACQACGAAKFT